MGVPAGGIPGAVRFTQGFVRLYHGGKSIPARFTEPLKRAAPTRTLLKACVPRRPGGEGSITPGRDCRDDARDVGPVFSRIKTGVVRKSFLTTCYFFTPYSLLRFAGSYATIALSLKLAFGLISFVRQIVQEFKEIRRLADEESIFREVIHD